MKNYTSFLKAQLFLITFLFTSLSMSQIYPTGVSQEEYKQLKSSELNIVQGLVSTEFDSIVEDAFSKYWTFSDYTFIDMEEYRSLVSSGSEFFLIPAKIDYTKYFGLENGPSLVESHLFGIFQIIASNGTTVSTINPMYKSVLPTTTASTFCSLNSMPTDFMSVVIKNLNLQCMEAKLDKYSNGRSRVRKINKNRKLIKTKPLYILDTDLNDKITSIEDVKKYYRGEVYVVSQEEYNELIEDDADVNLVFVMNDSTQNYVRIFELKSGRSLYYKRSIVHSKYPAGVIQYHIKKWN